MKYITYIVNKPIVDWINGCLSLFEDDLWLEIDVSSIVGWYVGWIVGCDDSIVGRYVGWIVGKCVGWIEGWNVGWVVGWFVW